ncbi:protein kinase [Streptomyces sp. NPDC102437]|uniref:protein kinase domain-containing protein n=1 Tax=Streptomyces sp. NPDC102437 TaxID=3366175 RepID=UPI003818D952
MGQQGELIDGRFRLIRSIGKGGMGRVWLAHDEELDREVALKEILYGFADGEEERSCQVERFRREAKALARLSRHPGIVTVFDILSRIDPPAIVMEHVEGPSLRELLDDEGRLPVRRVAEIGLAVLDSLAEAHRHNVVHRDLKPANILLSGQRVFIADFGIALISDATTMTRDGGAPVTLQYASPEQLQSARGDAASDLWSLGATLYELVEGRPPFRGDTYATLIAAICGREPEQMRWAGDLAPLLLRLLVKEPDGRATVEEAAETLSAIVNGPVTGSQEVLGTRTPPSPTPFDQMTTRTGPVAAGRAGMPRPAAPDPLPTGRRVEAVVTEAVAAETTVPPPAGPGTMSAAEPAAATPDPPVLIQGLPVARLVPALLDLWNSGHRDTAHRSLVQAAKMLSAMDVIETAQGLRKGERPPLATDLLRYAGRYQSPASLAALVTALRSAGRDSDADEVLKAAGSGRPAAEVPLVVAALRSRLNPIAGRHRMRPDHDADLVMGAVAERQIPLRATRVRQPDGEGSTYWFTVPEPRQLVAEDLSPRVVTDLLPGTPYLAVGHRGQALIAQLDDGRRGLLWDTKRVQRVGDGSDRAPSVPSSRAKEDRRGASATNSSSGDRQEVRQPESGFSAFWFAVPEPRQLVAEDLSPRVEAELLPGAWYLAVGQRGRALIAQTADGRRGLLWDTTRLQRADA